MFCQKCGNQLNDGAAFCPKCGNQILAINKDDVGEDISTNNNKINASGDHNGISPRVLAIVAEILFVISAFMLPMTNMSFTVSIGESKFSGQELFGTAMEGFSLYEIRGFFLVFLIILCFGVNICFSNRKTNKHFITTIISVALLVIVVALSLGEVPNAYNSVAKEKLLSPGVFAFVLPIASLIASYTAHFKSGKKRVQ